MRAVRLLALGWLFHFKMLARSSFNGLLGIVYPIFLPDLGICLALHRPRRERAVRRISTRSATRFSTRRSHAPSR
jgi:hypothetical protein